MKKFAYVDKSGIMHIVLNREDAENCSRNGKVIETDILAGCCYPVVNGTELIVYSETEIREEVKGDMLNFEEYPELVRLYSMCK